MIRLVIVTEIISPYRIPLFNTLAKQEDLNLHVIFLAKTDPYLRQWKIYNEEIEFDYQILPSWRKRIGRRNVLLNRGVSPALTAAHPDVILCGGYNYAASWQALRWSRSRQVPFLLWSESNRQDQRGGLAFVEFLKSWFLRRCDGFVVPGQSSREYLRVLGINEKLIFTAPNAIDNDLFARSAAAAHQNASTHRKELGLPERYFLFVGRLVREKGIFELLSAYAGLDEEVRQQIGLVFVGDGAERDALQKEATTLSSGMIRFAGFTQREQLGIYYALAEMLILPTYTDTWGLVVNEAMACGLPIILSRAAGCANDLVRENWNGLLVHPRNILSLAHAMKRMASEPDLCAAMGANSLQRIAQYSPQAWSDGVACAAAAMGRHD